MKIEPRTLKGFRDFLPKDARKREFVLETLKRVFESYGFEPLETPAFWNMKTFWRANTAPKAIN